MVLCCSRVQHSFRGWKLASYVQGLVLSQSVAHIVAVANLMPYLMDVLEEKLPIAAATANIQIGITAIMSILGSLLSDAYIGRYQMILWSTVIYVTGLLLLALAASPPHSKTNGSSQITTFRVGMLLVACGKAGHSPMLKEFGADQLKSSRDGDEDDGVEKRVAFWWCTGVSFGAFAGIILLAIVEGNRHWELAYGILAIAMSIAICLFISGKPLYRNVEPSGNVLTHVLPVFMAAFFNRHLNFPPNASQFNHGSGTELLPRTDGLRFLDKAAIIRQSTELNEQERKWRLCTVTEVEEIKILIHMIPMWTTFLIYGLVKSLGSTFFLQQGSKMNRELHVKVPLPLLLLFTRYVRVQITWLNKRLSKKSSTLKQILNPTRKIGIGMLFGILCCSVASSVEAKRLAIVRLYDLEDKSKDIVPISIFWLTPQFLLLGAMDGFTCTGINDFFYDQVPKSMRSFGYSFTASVIGVGSLLGVIVIIATNKATSKGGESSWIADTINMSRLDYFYQTLTVLSYINLILYGIVAGKYTYMTGATEDVQIVDVVSM